MKEIVKLSRKSSRDKFKDDNRIDISLGNLLKDSWKMDPLFVMKMSM